MIYQTNYSRHFYVHILVLLDFKQFFSDIKASIILYDTWRKFELQSDSHRQLIPAFGINLKLKNNTECKIQPSKFNSDQLKCINLDNKYERFSSHH